MFLFEVVSDAAIRANRHRRLRGEEQGKLEHSQEESDSDDYNEVDEVAMPRLMDVASSS